MVQKDDTTQLLLQILNDQNGRIRKLEQAVSNTEHFTQNIAALVQGMSQGSTIRGIETSQGSGQQPQIEVVATNVEIPIEYPINPVIGSEERPSNTNPNIPIIETPKMEQPWVE